MPHVIVKVWPMHNEEKKKTLALKITEVIKEVVETDSDSTSVSIVEIKKEHWKKEVYLKDIIGQEASLYKKPGYKC